MGTPAHGAPLTAQDALIGGTGEHRTLALADGRRPAPVTASDGQGRAAALLSCSRTAIRASFVSIMPLRMETR